MHHDGGTEHGGVAGPKFKEPATPDPPDYNDPEWDSALFPGTIWDGSVESSWRIDTYPDPGPDTNSVTRPGLYADAHPDVSSPACRFTAHASVN